jgi:ribosome-binding ATPase YchF (GTP1/OBG family)
MDLGIVGLPQVGKKTIFSLLTGMDAARAPRRQGIGYGTADVRDPRIDALSRMYNPKRTKYADFQIALPPDVQPSTARSAEWLDPIRRMDAFLHVVRAFQDESVFHVEGSVDPGRDVQLVEVEFLLADMQMVETRLERMAKDKAKKDPGSRQREQAVLERCGEQLEAERPLSDLEWNAEDLKLVRSLQFLTLKPTVVVLNVGDDLAAAREQCGDLVSQLESQVDEPAAHRLSRAAYECLGLISFFTVGPDEVRAWPVACGATAPQAAGRIHSDIERGFIRAETIACQDLLSAGSEREARAAGHYRLNGKDYVVRDGDIIEFRFSV